jgi:hypothetical protein
VSLLDQVLGRQNLEHLKVSSGAAEVLTLLGEAVVGGLSGYV